VFSVVKGLFAEKKSFTTEDTEGHREKLRNPNHVQDFVPE
jgi:hypothetical protein